MTARVSCRHGRSGVTLMEVILAMAILAGSMVTIGYLLKIGGRHATEADIKTRGQFICQSVLAMIDSGILPTVSAQNSPFPSNPDWLYSIEVQQQQTIGLLSVTVTAQRADDTRDVPIQASLVRWMVDPVYVQQLLDAAEEAAAEAEEEEGSALL